MERIGLTTLLPGQLPTLVAPSTSGATLQPITSPAEIPPVTIDPNYQNPVFATFLNKYAAEKSAALNAARAAANAANAVPADNGSDNIKNAAIGAGLLFVAFKFLL